MHVGTRSFLRPGVVVGMAAALGAYLGLEPGLAFPNVAIWAGALICGVCALLPLRVPVASRIAAIAAVFLAGNGAGRLAPKPLASPVLLAATTGEPVRLAGTLLEPVERSLGPARWGQVEGQPRLRLLVGVTHVRADGRWQEARGRVLLGGEDVPIEALVGDRVELSARLRVPEGPKNAGERDARPRLARAGIDAVGALERGAIAVWEPGDSWRRDAERFRARFASYVRDRLGPGDRASLVAALAVGERGGISVEANEAFTASGLAHVLSISGLHLAVAVALLAWALERLFGLSAWLSARVAPSRLSALVALPLTVLYVVLVGAPPPAVRAGLGAGLHLGAIAVGRTPDVFNTLGWALAAVALVDPAALDLVSTQLSFLGVAGLAYLTPRLRELIPIAQPDRAATGVRAMAARFGEATLLLVLGSVAATLASAPLTAATFERASLVAALANVVAWPASTLIVPSGVLGAALFSLHPALAGPFVAVAGWCAWGLDACARVFASWPLASIHVDPPTMLSVAGYALVVVTIANLRRWPRPPLAAGVVAGLALLVAGRPQALPHAEGQLEITFLAVGQGDSAVIRFPHGSTMVVDAGGDASMRFDPGARIVAPFLRAHGIERIDHVVASHPHPDHIGGLPSLFERFSVGELWHNGDGADEPGALARLVEVATKSGARSVDFRHAGLPAACHGREPLIEVLPAVAELAVGDPRCAAPPPVREIDGVRVEILHPLNGPERASFPELGANDNSLVLRLVHGKVRVLLAGDVEHEGEALLLARHADVGADLVKAPHHGSRTSSTAAFVARTKPAHVVFCVGEDNQWNFPAPEVVARYEAAGARSWRTDERPVTFVSDGERLVVRP